MNTNKFDRHFWRRLVKFLIDCLGSYKTIYFLGSFLVSLEALANYILPFALKSITSIIIGHDIDNSSGKVIIYICLLILLVPLITWGTYLRRVYATYAKGEMRKRFFTHLQRLPVVSIEGRTTSEWLTLFSSDLERVAGLYTSFPIRNLMKAVFIFPISFITLAVHDMKIALFGMALSFLCVFLSVKLNPILRNLNLRTQSIIAESGEPLIYFIRGAETIKVFSAQGVFSELYELKCRGIYKNRIKYRFINGLVDALTLFSQSIAQPVTFMFAAAAFLSGSLDGPSIVFMSTMVLNLIIAANSFIKFLNGIQAPITSAKRLFDVLSSPLENKGADHALMDYHHRNAISFSNVKFEYNPDRLVLKDVSFHVPTGYIVALIGVSGGGKSTILKLIEGFYENQSGVIEIFGASSDKLSKRRIRESISYVPQSPPAFEGTILENIALGKEHASYEEIKNAAQRSAAWDFINKLPQGFDTIISEHGADLSAGQRYRLAIARAFLKDAPIILLDEATSALDTESEKIILKALNELMEGRTAIVVTHRMETVQRADLILVLEDGRIVEQGSHEELMHTSKKYVELVCSADNEI